jgi:hypothetical protein
MDAAKRYRVDAEKVQKAVANELATKREKKRRQESSRRLETRRQPEPIRCLISGGVLSRTPPFSIGD